MPDDNLPLRTARALRWRMDGPPVEQNGVRIEMYCRDRDEPCFYVQYRDGQIVELINTPNYSADLGACQEVLDAIEQRGWEYKIINSRRAGKVYVTLYDQDGTYVVRTRNAPTLPAAICEAFCQAVGAAPKKDV
jgi:hypothetical protein